MKDDDSDPRLFIALILWMGSLVYLAGNACLAWALKDGMGPNAVESGGLVALNRFWIEVRVPLLYASIPFVGGILLVARCFRAEE
jgi:hypothetical protein